MASDLKEHLLEIRAQYGKLTPRIVATAAKDKDHPLHDQVYDCTPKEAADRYYLGNAARLLRVTFRITDDSGHSANLRHFWVQKGTREEPESQYVPIEEVIQDPISRNIMLRQMLRDWKRFKARYASYSEFVEMVLNDPDFIDPDEEYGGNGNGTEG